MARAGSSRAILTPNGYLFDRLGSQGNRFPFLLCERAMNQMKGRIFNLPQNEMFENMRMSIGVFRYINHPDALPTVQRNRRELRTAVIAIAQIVTPLRDAVAIHREFDSNWYREAADSTRGWLSERVLDIRLRFGELERAGNLPPNAASVQSILDELANQMHYIQPPPDI
ncbi:hypothetical protein CCHL11_03720 [Colletotrichum chlorophyti]|uniref:Uncharacterized protein n=1 Tax=Colletotrichum chlorophyti TaxID=708187 RepID=A0A1Q8RQZ0_9PEZI|nr:hypothetical protein CCHL11_03720 [Colletotrichum chlorophyti]